MQRGDNTHEWSVRPSCPLKLTFSVSVSLCGRGVVRVCMLATAHVQSHWTICLSVSGLTFHLIWNRSLFVGTCFVCQASQPELPGSLLSLLFYIPVQVLGLQTCRILCSLFTWVIQNQVHKLKWYGKCFTHWEIFPHFVRASLANICEIARTGDQGPLGRSLGPPRLGYRLCFLICSIVPLNRQITWYPLSQTITTDSRIASDKSEAC